MKSGIEVASLTASYVDGKKTVHVLDRLSMRVGAGQVGVVIGPSGAGKTTLMNCIAGLHAYQDGSVSLALDNRNRALQHTHKQPLSALDRRRVGIAFQQSHLWSHFTVRENLLHPQIRLGGVSKRDARAWADHLLAELRLEGLGDVRVSELSGGQKQRVAIARGFVLRPDVLLLDEITANQDPENVSRIFSLVRAYVAETGCTVLTVSHDMEFVRRIADKLFFLKGGKIAAEGSPDAFFGASQNADLTRFVNAF